MTGERVTPLEHLAEMDRLLHDIQAELSPGREPAPALAAIPDPPPPPPVPEPPPPSPPPPPPPPGIPEPPPAPPAPALDWEAQRQLLTARLLASARELFSGYEQVLAQAPSTRRRPAPAPARGNVGVSAGPFPSLEDLRAFEAAIRRLPGVRDVDVQAYEGTDRAVLDVRLDPTST